MHRWFKNLAVFATVTVLAVFAASCGGSSEETTSAPESATTNPALPQQTSQSGNVNLSVTPADISKTATTWTFRIVLDSQGPELTEDLAAASVITDDAGKEFPAKGFDGNAPGGTHREGTLSFDAINPAPKSITLKIRGVGGIGERSFSWAVAE